MTGEIVSIVALLGWLFIAGSALASYRLGWGQLARMALVWIAIFTGLTLLVGFFYGG
ncbi:hypothetical protein [Erythrobacter sp.]|uniref:hypothetical protein n=1 Tax=Erythrobacter sp. TaxID=1042 RepID=UPI001425CD68|nr:hypothetical protein [Erythrobacter sp.]QIQ86074.1 MAG: hypothetical protein G9473_04765 [Erythrobacter sp.]